MSNPYISNPHVPLVAHFDPTGHWGKQGIGHEQLLESCGYLPTFLTHKNEDETVQACFNRCYPFGGWQPGPYGKADDKGVSRYPGDPPQYPIVRFDFPNQQVYIYPHAFVLIRDKDGKRDEIARMD